ncbi:hypothetical protein NDU88_001541 [Pleurodeles waltl]|uniref:Uncharacterized protein n=1 Tax=Pleurodeles waltl TaxID=8319 RepID=A0AAV7LDG4_PLEWA|nr:hypothetical protein NDU88_001541 [Pleurodeles waltl]
MYVVYAWRALKFREVYIKIQSCTIYDRRVSCMRDSISGGTEPETERLLKRGSFSASRRQVGFLLFAEFQIRITHPRITLEFYFYE